MTRFAAVLSLFVLSRIAHADEPEAAGAPEHEHGPWEMRVSIESPLYTHATDTKSVLGETEIEPDVMVSYVLEQQHLSFDLEVGEGVLLQRGGYTGGLPRRTGTTVRPGVAFTPDPETPVFVTALFPIHLEPSPVLLSLRLGAGVNLAHTPIGKWFIEADIDFHVAGGDAPNPFNEQTIVLATGLLFHLPG